MDTWYWGWAVVSIVLMPTVFTIYGSLYIRGIPHKLNSFFGYRTKRTTQNQATWDFAHNYLGKIWLAVGITILPGTVITMFLQYGASTNKIAMAVLALGIGQVSVLIISLIKTQTALKTTFDENGNRRQA